MNTNDRNVIFISHATPEDNEFSIWLASRLQADGYEVWIDKAVLLGGEKTWQVIDQVIRNKAIKLLLVYSENICVKKQKGKLKDGIDKEKSMAEAIAIELAIDDFIILLNIDGSEYNNFIGANRILHIDFFENWATGYAQLLKKFEKENLPHEEVLVGNFSKWYEEEYAIKNGVRPMQELYHDTWWPISNLPKEFFIYEFSNKAIALTIKQQHQYPAGSINNIVSTFDDVKVFEITTDSGIEFVSYKEKHTILVKNVIAGINYRNANIFPNERDAYNHFMNLLQRTFHLIMRHRQLSWYSMANKKLAYFFPQSLQKEFVRFEYNFRSQKSTKRKAIVGKYLSGNWHYAISAKPILSPQVAFSLKSHIIFTEDGHNPWDDKVKMHTARRSKGKTFFNEDWRDLMIAFLHALMKKENTINISLSPKFELHLHPWTNRYISNFGYIEPKEKDRHGILVLEEEFIDEEEVIEEKSNYSEEEDNA